MVGFRYERIGYGWVLGDHEGRLQCTRAHDALSLLSTVLASHAVRYVLRECNNHPTPFPVISQELPGLRRL